MSSRYVRKFDWDEARARNAAGETYAELAREYGVTPTAVQRVCDPAVNQRMRETSERYQRSGICRDCGKQGVTPSIGRCTECAGMARATTVRPAELHCVVCKEWKPDADFPSNRLERARRYRHGSCRACLTVAKRDWRHRNLEKARAYDREYKRKQRAAA